MKILSGFFALMLCTLHVAAQPNLRGAWRLTSGPAGTNVVFIITDTYMAGAFYEKDRFAGTSGGPYTLTGNTLTFTPEFDTADSTQVGQPSLLTITFQSPDRITATSPNGGDAETYERIDAANAPIAGLWRITGRANEQGEITQMPRRARKTYKILSGSRFQWVAINPETKQFFGTGGGTYRYENGQYTETLEFFSRDNSRVGRSLTFQADVTPDTWRHRGQSSTGGKVDEVWSREK